MRALAERLLGGPRRSGSARRLDPGGIRLEDGLLVADPAAAVDDQGEVVLAMRLLAARARTGRMVAGSTMTWLHEVFRRPPIETWSAPLRAAFLAMLAGSDGAYAHAPELARLRYEFRTELDPAAESKEAFVERCTRWMAEELATGGAWRCWARGRGPASSSSSPRHR